MEKVYISPNIKVVKLYKDSLCMTSSSQTLDPGNQPLDPGEPVGARRYIYSFDEEDTDEWD